MIYPKKIIGLRYDTNFMNFSSYTAWYYELLFIATYSSWRTSRISFYINSC